MPPDPAPGDAEGHVDIEVVVDVDFDGDVNLADRRWVACKDPVLDARVLELKGRQCPTWRSPAQVHVAVAAKVHDHDHVNVAKLP
jgi:hypothetical protein